MMNLNSATEEVLQVGFVYTVEVVRDGKIIDTECTHNLVPTEGIEHILRAILLSGTQITAWAVAIFEGNYTPIAAVTGVTVAAASTESNAYASSTRPSWAGVFSAGTADNSASKAEFVMTAPKLIYGAFLASNSTKGATTGTLLSIARFASPKDLDTGDTLRVVAGLTLISAT